MKRIYLDWAASAPTKPEVAEKINQFLKIDVGNPSSIHWFGRTQLAIIDDTKEKLGQWLGCEARELYFTSGATESINWTILGFASAEKTIISTPVEHKATLEALEKARRVGARVIMLEVDNNGRINLDKLYQQLELYPSALVSLTWVNNETGNLENIEKVSQTLKKDFPLSRLHVDATQALGWLDQKMGDLHIHYLSASAHKLGGLKGTGLLIMKRGFELYGLISGGGQEYDLRGGTENITGIISWGVVGHDYSKEDKQHIANLRNKLVAGLKAIPGTIIVTDLERSSPHIINVRFEKIDAEILMMRLDLAGFAVSTGSACTTGATDPSHVLLAMGLSQKDAKSALRISIGSTTTMEDLESFISSLEIQLEQLVKIN